MVTRKPATGSQRVTQRDVAERAGVAISSVSYVLNNGPRPVSEETRQRVLRAIDELGYRPNEHARRLILQNWDADASPRQFGILLSGGPRVVLARSYYSSLIVGMFDEAVHQRYGVRFIHLYDEMENPVLFNELMHREVIGGLVLIHVRPPSVREQELLTRIIERVRNVICLDTKWTGLPSITFDKLDAGRQAADHLVALGHRRIGFIGNHDGRFDGYLQSLRLRGIPHDPSLVASERISSSDAVTNSPEGGWIGAQQLLQQPNRPTALLTASDEVAIGALRAAREAGLRVPEDLSIASVDDIDLASYTSPPLTTVRVPKAEMASLAVRMLVEGVSRSDSLPINSVLPVELMIRASTGPAPENA